MKLCLDFDDFSPRNTNFGILEDLKEHYPGFKVTLFTVPWDVRWGEATPITEEKYKPFCEAVKKAEGWIEIALHGLTHTVRTVRNSAEYELLDYERAKKRTMIAEKMFINRGISYAKIFKAPQWLLSAPAKKAVEDQGFTVVEDGYYNWNLKDKQPKLKKGVLVAHGHIHNVCDNGLEDVAPKLMQLPTDTEFIWLSEYLNVKKVNSKQVLENLKSLEKIGKNEKTKQKPNGPSR